MPSAKEVSPEVFQGFVLVFTSIFSKADDILFLYNTNRKLLPRVDMTYRKNNCYKGYEARLHIKLKQFFLIRARGTGALLLPLIFF